MAVLLLLNTFKKRNDALIFFILEILECQPGFYGANCGYTCSLNCYYMYTNRCDTVSGYCNNGCLSGWTGSRCSQRNFFVFTCKLSWVEKLSYFFWTLFVQRSSLCFYYFFNYSNRSFLKKKENNCESELRLRLDVSNLDLDELIWTHSWFESRIEKDNINCLNIQTWVSRHMMANTHIVIYTTQIYKKH